MDNNLRDAVEGVLAVGGAVGVGECRAARQQIVGRVRQAGLGRYARDQRRPVHGCAR